MAAIGIVKRKVIGDPNGNEREVKRYMKCQRCKSRNADRRALRITRPEWAGRQFHCWPLPS